MFISKFYFKNMTIEVVYRELLWIIAHFEATYVSVNVCSISFLLEHINSASGLLQT